MNITSNASCFANHTEMVWWWMRISFIPCNMQHQQYPWMFMNEKISLLHLPKSYIYIFKDQLETASGCPLICVFLICRVVVSLAPSQYPFSILYCFFFFLSWLYIDLNEVLMQEIWLLSFQTTKYQLKLFSTPSEWKRQVVDLEVIGQVSFGFYIKNVFKLSPTLKQLTCVIYSVFEILFRFYFLYQILVSNIIDYTFLTTDIFTR